MYTPRSALNGVTLLYVFCVPWDIVPIAFGHSLTPPLGLMLFFTWVIHSLRNSRLVEFPAPALWLIMLYVGWITCTAFWSIDTELSVVVLQGLYTQVVLVVVLANSLGPIWLWALGTYGVSATVMGLILIGNPGVSVRAGRANIDGLDENVTALVLMVGLSALLFLVFYWGGQRAILLMPPVVIVGLAVLHTGSRSGAIAMIAVLVVSLMQHVWRGTPRRLIRRGQLGRSRAALLSEAGALGLVAYLSYHLADGAGLIPIRVADIFAGSGNFGDSGRSIIIDLYLRSFDQWQIFGVGIGNDWLYLGETQQYPHHAHSIFWSTWIDTGIVGVLLLGGFLVFVLIRGFSCPSPGALLLIAIPVVAFATSLSFLTSSVFWFVVAFALTQRFDRKSSVAVQRDRATVLRDGL